MKYIIVEAMDKDFLVKRVNVKISEGYVPQGGLCYNGSFYFQAMISQ